MRRIMVFLGLVLLSGVLLGQDILPSGHGQTSVQHSQQESVLLASSCSSNLAISCGATLSGQFSGDDCIGYGIAHGQAWVGPEDYYHFAGIAGQTISVDLRFPTAADFLIIGVTQATSSTWLKLVSSPSRDNSLTLAVVLPETTSYALTVAAANNDVTINPYGSYTLSLSCTVAGSLPDLAFYKPAKWSDSVVVSSVTGCYDSVLTAAATCVDSSNPTSATALYVNLAIQNAGSAPVLSTYVVDMYVDDIYNRSFSDTNDLLPGWYSLWADRSLGSFPNGTHTIKLVADAANAVIESNETNNISVKSFTVGTPSAGNCTATSLNLCLSTSRFRVSVAWQSTTASGSATAVPMTSNTGYFWFFDFSNVETVVKVLDATGVNGKFWVFAAGMTNVQATITVTDTKTSAVKTYTNPQGTAFQPVQDTNAFVP